MSKILRTLLPNEIVDAVDYYRTPFLAIPTDRLAQPVIILLRGLQGYRKEKSDFTLARISLEYQSTGLAPFRIALDQRYVLRPSEGSWLLAFGGQQVQLLEEPPHWDADDIAGGVLPPLLRREVENVEFAVCALNLDLPLTQLAAMLRPPGPLDRAAIVGAK
jgi:hypothetical protein